MRRIGPAGAALATGLAIVAASMAGCGPARDPAGAGPAARVPARQLSRSIADAYVFLHHMMDRYAAGPVPRLVQSFTGGVLGRQRFTASETYDDAVVIDAYLAEGTPAGRSRAVVIGNALLDVQANDPRHDGRVRAAYRPAPLRSPAAATATDPATSTGEVAWAGQALVQLYAATGRKAYLAGAEAIGNWVQACCHDSRGAGGYTGGETAGGQQIAWKSTEHNIDLYALFSLLADQTRDPVWSARAQWAKRLIAGMWDPRQGRFYVGTTSDGRTPNDAVLPEDVNSWSYLALRDASYAASPGWDARNLAVTADGFSGVSFCRADRTGIWYEGSAHLADALELRGEPGDAALAARYLAGIYHAQVRGPGADGRGIIAASRNGLGDCGGGSYYASLHTGTTAWYILAAKKINPFAIIPAPSRKVVPARMPGRQAGTAQDHESISQLGGRHGRHAPPGARLQRR